MDQPSSSSICAPLPLASETLPATQKCFNIMHDQTHLPAEGFGSGRHFLPPFRNRHLVEGFGATV